MAKNANKCSKHFWSPVWIDTSKNWQTILVFAVRYVQSALEQREIIIRPVMCNLVITELEGELSRVSSYFHKEVGGDWRLPSSFLLPHFRIPVFLTLFLFWPRFHPIVVLSFFSLFSLLLLLLPLRCFVAFSSPCSSHSSSQISSFFFLPVFFCITVIMLISFVSYVCPCFPSDFLPCSLPAFFLILFHCPPTLPYSQGGAWNWFQF